MFDSIVASLFDPAWNHEHGPAIWAIIVGALFASGLGLPLPEDIPLTLSGFTTAIRDEGHFVFAHYLTTFLIVVVPILTGDLCAYWLGRRFGLPLRHRFKLFRRAITKKRLRRVKSWFARYGSFTVFMGRQVAGVRFVTFFMAGTIRMSVWKFVLFDFLGCMVSVPVWLTLGYFAARHGREWLSVASSRTGMVFLSVVVVIVAVFVWRLRRKARAEAAESGRPSDIEDLAPPP